MIELGLDANAGVDDLRFAPEDRPIYAAIASGVPQLVRGVMAAS
jgi:hypothetical protein